MASTSERVPDWLLERLAAGELPAAQAHTLRKRLVAAGDHDRLDALAASNAEILAARPADKVTAEVRRRAAAWGARRLSRRRTIARGVGEAERSERGGEAGGGPKGEANSPRIPISVWALFLATARAAAIALLFVHAPAEPSRTELARGQQEQETITSKGLQPSLGLYRKATVGVERLGPASRLHPGDILQMRYVAAGKRYGVVASCDARGAVTLHLPETPGQAVALAKDGERALAHAYELDDSPGFERFVFVTADVPFDTELVARNLKQGTALPEGVATWSITFEKEAP